MSLSGRIAWLVFGVFVAGCSSAASPDGGDLASEPVDETQTSCPAGAVATQGGACSREGALCPYDIQCYCGVTMRSECSCTAGHWQCPVDCYPQPQCPDSGPDVSDVQDVVVTDAGDAPMSMACNGDPPTGSCTPGSTCIGSARCNPIVTFSCMCATDGTWQCSAHCI